MRSGKQRQPGHHAVGRPAVRGVCYGPGVRVGDAGEHLLKHDLRARTRRPSRRRPAPARGPDTQRSLRTTSDAPAGPVVLAVSRCRLSGRRRSVRGTADPAADRQDASARGVERRRVTPSVGCSVVWMDLFFACPSGPASMRRSPRSSPGQFQDGAAETGDNKQNGDRIPDGKRDLPESGYIQVAHPFPS